MAPITLDAIAVLTFCGQWAAAEQAARARLDEVRADPGASRLANARATRALADVLIDAGRSGDAGDLVVESRALYRPLEHDDAARSEIALTAARQAFGTARSAEAEELLSSALDATDRQPTLWPWRARALRFQAHLLVLRGDFEAGAARIDEAIAASGPAGASEDAEPNLLRLELLFTRAELHVILEEPARARETARAALDVLETRFRAVPMLREHGRRRATTIQAAYVTGVDPQPSR